MVLGWQRIPEAHRRRVGPALLLAVLTLAAAAGDRVAHAQSVSRTELEGIQRELAREEGRLGKGQAERRALLAELEQTERDAAAVIRRLRQLERALADRTLSLQASRQARRVELERAAAARAALVREVRAGYLGGRADYLKMWLNQEDPRAASRAVVLHGFVARARARRINERVAELERLSAVERELAAETQALRSLAAGAAVARTELDSRRARRTAVLARLNAQITDSEERVRLLRRNAAQLSRLLDEVATAAPRQPPRPLAGSDRPAFASLAGKLPWPTRGRLAIRFGTSRGSGDLTWTGVRIAAPAEQPIRAVAGGRVAYADWLRGFGLLLIVDHGDGYMSLYGHARELLRERGEWVEPGEVLGTVGDSGGQSSSGLYFEIRRNGRPRDPTRWCAGRPRDSQTAGAVPAPGVGRG